MSLQCQTLLPSVSPLHPAHKAAATPSSRTSVNLFKLQQELIVADPEKG
jgi:hypothetical protein